MLAETDSSGDIAGDINTYDEYGNRGTDNHGRFQYAGRIWLLVLNLIGDLMAGASDPRFREDRQSRPRL